MDVQPTTIVFRRNTAAGWTENNRILLSGEPGYETDTGRVKVGNGYIPWVRLSYLDSNSDLAAAIQAHVNSLTPHPVYDDGPSLELLYENAKV